MAKRNTKRLNFCPCGGSCPVNADSGSPVISADGPPPPGVDETDQSFMVVELAPDVAISPRGGNIVAKRYIDYLFPETT